MSSDRTRQILQAIVTVVVVGAGAVTCIGLIRTRPVPARQHAFASILEVEVSRVEPTREQFPVVGYGTVRPKNQVAIVPLVTGRLIHSHRDLAPGKIIPQGELLFEIDPTVYEARVKQVEAEIARLESVLDRYDTEMDNLEERVVTAGQMLAINDNDYLTSKRLYDDEHVGTLRDIDQVRLVFLRQKDVLNEFLARQSMIPHQKLDVQAQLDGARARLQQSQHDLKGTKIVCPFDARIEAVHAKESQVVTAHFSIATLTDMSAFELAVGIDPREIRWLDPTVQPPALLEHGGEGSPPVKVRWSLHGQQFTWSGRVTRFERVDERTRTAQMVVEVRNVDMIAQVDYGSMDIGPALAIGMFCSAELPGAALEDALLIPRHTLYDNRWVYVFEPEDGSGDAALGRLGRRTVSVLRTVGDRALVDYRNRSDNEICELQPADQLIVSRLTKPVVGMAVRLRGEKLAPVAPPAFPSDVRDTSVHPRNNAALAHIMPLLGNN